MPRRLFYIFSIAAIALASATAGIISEGANEALAAGSTYYLDCAAGNDGSNGTSQASAWKTIGRANSANLNPGDSLLLKRGCTWNGPLKATWHGNAGSPIMIGAYGSGDRPMIKNAPNANVKLMGSYTVVENIQTTHDLSQYTIDGSCMNQPVGWKIGFQFDGPSHHNTVRNSLATNHAMGVGMSDKSHHNVVTNNEIRDNMALWDNNPGSALGGLGVNLHGDSNEVSWNTFSNNKSPCARLSNGAASGLGSSISIELYNASNSSVHHNVSYDRTFVELGSSAQIISSDNTFAYNVHSSPYEGGRFVVTRGNGGFHGPVWRTKLFNNVVHNTAADGQGVVCGHCSPQVLTMKNNVIVASNKALYVGAGEAITESNNIFWHPGGLPLPNNFIQNWNIDGSSQAANPQLVNPAGHDFHIQPSSPGINNGSNEPASEGYAHDLDGDPVPESNVADIGVDERDGMGQAANPAPAVTAPLHTTPSFRLTPDQVPVGVSWSGSDENGISKYELQLKINSGNFVTVRTIATGNQNHSSDLNLRPWDKYQLRVRATDSLGAVSDWAVGPVFSIQLWEESSKRITYDGAWQTESLFGAYGGDVKQTDVKGRTATFKFKGTSVAWISTRGNNRGRAEVWLDGSKVEWVDLYSNEGVTPRRVVFRRDGLDPNVTHTLEIRVLGAKNPNSSSRQVDLDAIVIFQ